MNQGTVVITGGNVGLGYRCAEAIALTRSWHVILACRDEARATAAAEQLRQETGHASIEVMKLDLASLESVRQFASALAERDLPPLRGLVLNAGLQVISGRTFTKDGFETTFGVNHLGHFLLANLLARQLVAPARILFVSSGTHDPRQMTGMPVPRYEPAARLAHPPASEAEDPGLEGRRAYTTSKLCNVLCAYELDRRLRRAGISTEERPITVNAFDPGLMPGSGLARDYGALAQLGWRYILPVLTLFVPNVNTTKRSGRALARLVLDPALAHVSGKYFEGARAIPSSEESYDEAKAAELWEGSARLVSLRPTEEVAPPAPQPRGSASA